MKSYLRDIKRMNRKTLTAFVAAVIGIIILNGVIFVALYESSRKNIISLGKENAIKSAQEFNDYLLTSIDATELVAYTIDNLIKEGKDSEYIREYLIQETNNYSNAISENYTGIYGLIDGNFLDGTGWIPDENFEPTSRPWYKNAVKGKGKTMLVSPYIDMETGHIMMTVCKLLSDGESAIGMDLTLDRLQEITDEIYDDTDGDIHVMVLDEKKEIVALSNHDDSKDQALLEDLPKRVGRMLEGHEETDFEVISNGKRFQVYAEPIQDGWFAISMLDEGDMFDSLRILEVFSAITILVALFLVSSIFLSISRAQFEAEDMNMRLKSATSIYDAVYLHDLVNDTYEYISGAHTQTEKVGEEYPDAAKGLLEVGGWLSDEQTREEFLEFLDLETLPDRMVKADTITLEFLDRQNRWCRARFVVANRDDYGIVTKVLFMVEIIDEERRARDRLRYLSETDKMTGINNRGSGESKITAMLGNGKGGMFLLLDADHFKSINDNYGHGIGDKVIIAIAKALKASFRDNDVVLRLGGDEFAAYADGVVDQLHGKQIVDRLIERVSEITIPEMKGRRIEISVGVAFYQAFDTYSFEELYKRADRCTYLSKKHRGSYATYHYSLV